jgi:hypothetical protein
MTTYTPAQRGQSVPSVQADDIKQQGAVRQDVGFFGNRQIEGARRDVVVRVEKERLQIAGNVFIDVVTHEYTTAGDLAKLRTTTEAAAQITEHHDGLLKHMETSGQKSMEQEAAAQLQLSITAGRVEADIRAQVAKGVISAERGEELIKRNKRRLNQSEETISDSHNKVNYCREVMRDRTLFNNNSMLNK